ncbi:glycosyltransferase [Ktedonobacter racemifer]|uniref:glycosyltransferase n=1 Tax=Ktedonobacter racemifer TaxID=363277 RepID=UPI00146DA49A|nr:glycosyltransferase [Ktedonobacter racemifer]
MASPHAIIDTPARSTVDVKATPTLAPSAIDIDALPTISTPAVEPALTSRHLLLPAKMGAKPSTLEMLALLPGKALRSITTHRMPAIKKISQLDKFATVPAAAVQGLKNGEQKISNTKLRLVGIFFMLVATFYLFWLATILNLQAPWLSLPFFLAMCYLTLIVCLTVYNNWTRVVTELVGLPGGQEPIVAVCIPTYGETPTMVQITIESVLSQDWPHQKLLIIVGDDSHRPEMKEMVTTLQNTFSRARIVYHEPPRKGAPERRGSAKDGNLNSMLAYVTQQYPDIAYIETRDADDVVGSPQFLRYVIGHLQRNEDVAYVQTIKDTLVSEGDPFGNRQTFFYRGVMLARNASNSVFPCGSGLVWRKEKLASIGGFPTWNLVEDLYSGYVAMQHGLKGVYLPVVGAVGQVSPEDIPNVYKQLGTWALDTCRIFFWKNPWLAKGLTFKQRMQFTELSLFYLLSYPLLIFVLTPVISLCTGIYPFTTSNLDYVLHFWPFILCIELLLANMSDSTSFEEIWRARQMWLGMTFVFIKSSILALIYGPNRKPTYKVTRKTQEAGVYLREVSMQVFVCLLLLMAIIYNLAIHHTSFLRDSDLGSILWAVFFILLLIGIIRRSWFGYRIRVKRQ